MATVTKKLSLDVSRKNLLPNVIAKQYDTDSRFLTVQLLDEGRELKAESGSTVIISFRRADGQAKSFKGNANEDGTVTVPLANWALELDDIVECDISVYRGEAKLSTTTFKLEVQPAANGSGDISEDEDYDILKQLIVEVKTATEGANSAAAEAEKWKNVSATAKGLEAGAAPTVSLSDTESGKTFSFGIPKGDKGDPGLISGVKVNGTPLVPDAEKAVDVIAYAPDNKPEIGGRNLLLGSGARIQNAEYNTARYDLGDTSLRNGEKVTLSIKGKLGEGKNFFEGYNSGESAPIFTVYLDENGYGSATALWTEQGANSYLNIFAVPSSSSSESTIEWIKLERGEIATDWTPAPEDKQDKIELIGGRNLLLNSKLKKTFGPNNRPYPNLLFQLSEPLVVGEKYYMRVKATIDTEGLYIIMSGMVGETERILADSAVLKHNGDYYELGFTCDYAVTDFRLTLVGTNTPGTVTYENPKLERGELATDWIPAPEDLETAPYIGMPLPSTIEGSVGSAAEYARGDHLHPFSDFEFVSRGAVTPETDWNTVTVSGIYTVLDGEGANHPNVNLLYGALCVFNRYDYEDVYTIMQIYFPNSGDFVYRMAYTSRISELTFGPWYHTASNTSGILPVEQGGTGVNGAAARAASSSKLNTENFRTNLGVPLDGGFMAAQYFNGSVGEDGCVPPDYSSNFLFGDLDVNGYISVAPFAPEVHIGGGSQDKIHWHKQLAFSDNVSAAQLALASLYESRSVSAASADMPMGSPTIDGELSALDRNMISVYTTLCLNPDSGKTVDSVPENLRAQVQAAVEKTLAERKEAEERYKAEKEKRKAELEAEPEPSTKKDGTEESQ